MIHNSLAWRRAVVLVGGLVRTVRRWTWFQILIGLALGAIALLLALRQIAWPQVWDAWRGVRWPWYVGALIVVLGVSAGKALRWQVLYPGSASPLPWHDHFGILLIAQMLNTLIPIRLGEVARLGLMQQAKRPLGMTLGTIAAEKALDLLTTGAFLLAALPTLAWTEARATALTVIATGALVLVALLALGLTRVFWLRLLERLPRPRRQWLRDLMERLLRLPQAMLEWAGALSLSRWALASGLSVGVWGLSVVCMELVLRAFGWTMPHAALLLMLAITFTNLLPQPPALVGTVLFVTQEVMVPLGLARAEALALGAALNLVMVLPVVIGGAWAASVRLGHLMLVPGGGGWRRALGLDILLKGGPPR